MKNEHEKKNEEQIDRLFAFERFEIYQRAVDFAEGFSNYYKKDKKKYFRYARGSIYECVPALRISLRQKYLDADEHEKMYKECYEISRRISGLINSVDKWSDQNKKKSNR